MMKRYLISMGLMETNPEIIDDRKAFKEVSVFREQVARSVDSIIKLYCECSGINPRIKSRYEKDIPFNTISLDNPKKIILHQIDPQIQGWSLPLVYQPLPEEFVQAIVQYRDLCLKQRQKGGGLGVFSRMRINSRCKKIGGIYLVQDFTGVIAEPDKIEGLEAEVKLILNELKSLKGTYDANKCVVSQVSY